MFKVSLSPDEKLMRAIVTMQQTAPFFAYLLMNFKMSAIAAVPDKDAKTLPGRLTDKEIPTAAVDKYGNLLYNPAFVDKLRSDELRGLVAHEALHIAKGDFFRCGKRDPMLWNVASDCIINYMLVKDSFVLPPNGYNPNRDGVIEIKTEKNGKKVTKKYTVEGKTTEQFYEELLQDVDHIKQYVLSQGGGGDGNNPGHGGMDVHIQGDADNPDDRESTSKAAQAESKWKKITVEAATVARQRGTMPGCAEGILDEILNPKIDWRNYLRNFVTNHIPTDYTNRSPGRRFYGTGVWFPKVLRENVEVFVSIDCSGSTMGDRVDFVSEVVGILTAYEQVKARMICWSTSVNDQNDVEIDTNTVDKLKGMKIKDVNGGTELSVYADYLKKKDYKARCHIILTDGFIENNPRLPPGNIVFVLSKGGSDEILKKTGWPVLRIEDKTY